MTRDCGHTTVQEIPETVDILGKPWGIHEGGGSELKTY
ncbi:unnamed protein product, partial [Staurois parvus]